jgi:hypothetical protein
LGIAGWIEHKQTRPNVQIASEQTSSLLDVRDDALPVLIEEQWAAKGHEGVPSCERSVFGQAMSNGLATVSISKVTPDNLLAG